MKTKKKNQGDIVIDDHEALIIIDVQRDFCSGGTLSVPGGDQIVPVLNNYIQLFDHALAQIYATRDWHPSNHISFKGYGGVWPPHCIQNSNGAEFHPDLELVPNVKIISKATSPEEDTYSGFDNTELAEMLRNNHAKRLFIGGLATEYCVKNTVLDALKLGFKTILLVDAIRGMNLQHNNSNKAIEEMIQKGVQTTTILQIKVKKALNNNETEEKIRSEKEKRNKARMRNRGPYRKAWRPPN